MGKIKPIRPVKLVIGLICPSEELMSVINKNLSKKFGEIDFESEILAFDHTTYYKGEFGDNLKRKFISFKRLIKPAKLINIKHFILKLENKFSQRGKRRINIDPGYITLSKFVLSTTKDYSHRIYLGKGVFAEVTLYFENKSFREFNWTYPDYRTQAYLDIFNKIRNIFLKQTRTLRCP